MKKAQSKTTEPTYFQVSAGPGSTVCVTGTFNNWNPRQYQMLYDADAGIFRITLELPPGRHEYKFVVNGEWRCDPNCPDWVVNEHGTLNSVIIACRRFVLPKKNPQLSFRHWGEASLIAV